MIQSQMEHPTDQLREKRVELILQQLEDVPALPSTAAESVDRSQAAGTAASAVRPMPAAIGAADIVATMAAAASTPVS